MGDDGLLLELEALKDIGFENLFDFYTATNETIAPSAVVESRIGLTKIPNVVGSQTKGQEGRV